MIYRTTVIDFEADEPAQAELFDARMRNFLTSVPSESPLGGIKITHLRQGDRVPARAVSTREIEHVAEKLQLDRGSFYWQLLMLITRADVDNRIKLEREWPWIVEAVDRWHLSNPDDDVDYSDLIRARNT